MPFSYITRGGVNPQGKAKVYFCAADADMGLRDEVAEELLNEKNCAFWYYTEQTVSDEAEHKEALADMRLFIVPVTARFLREPSRAKDMELPLALEKHIPVLPLMMEEGLLPLYGGVFGELQYLSRFEEDETGLSYEEKYKRFLNGILVGGELAERIRTAFDLRLFLSYRKKDRRYADALMRLIHKCEGLEAVSVWYDEFLVPGENFNDAIEQAMDACDAVALVVTPNLVCEKNYVAGVEYPMARERGKAVYPVEFVKTDRKKLLRAFSGLKEPASSALAEIQALFASLPRSRKRKTAEQEYLLGLAYMGGVCVERDYERGVSLLYSAAEQGHLEALEKLHLMYFNGDGVERNLLLSAHWLSRKIELLQRKSKKSKTAEDAYLVAWEAVRLGDHYRASGETEKAQEAYTSAYEHCLRAATLSQNGKRERHLVGVCAHNCGEVAKMRGKYPEAVPYYDVAATIFEEEWKKEGLLSRLAALTDTLRSQSSCLMAESRYEEATVLCRRVYEMLSPYQSENVTRRAYADTLTDLGYALYQVGRHKEAIDCLSESATILRERDAEQRTPISACVLSGALRLIASAYCGMGQYEKAQLYAEEAYELTRDAAEKEPTIRIFRYVENALSCLCSLYQDVANWTEMLEITFERIENLRLIAEREHHFSHETVLSLCAAYTASCTALFTLGRFDDARPYAEEALRLVDAIPEEERFYPRIFYLYTSAHLIEGKLFRQAGRYEEAYAIFKEQFALRETFCSRYKTTLSLHYMFNMCDELARLCDLMKKPEEGLPYAEKMLELAKKYLAVAESYTACNGVWQAYYNIARLLQAMGRNEEAKAAIQRTIAYGEEVHAKYPSSAAKRLIGVAHCIAADICLSLREDDEAESATDVFVRIFAELSETEGMYNDHRNLVLGYERRRSIAIQRGDAGKALAEGVSALTEASRLCELAPSSYEAHHDLLRCAKQVYEDGRKLENTAHALSALSLWVKGACFTVEKNPMAANRLDVVLGADRYGDALLKVGESALALEQYELALSYARSLAEDEPTATYCRNLCIMLRKVGNAHAKSDNHFGAKTCFKEELLWRRRTFALSKEKKDEEEIVKTRKNLSDTEGELNRRYGIPLSPPEAYEAEWEDGQSTAQLTDKATKDTPSEGTPVEDACDRTKEKKPSLWARLFGKKK